jgi:hypothetical protein
MGTCSGSTPAGLPDVVGVREQRRQPARVRHAAVIDLCGRKSDRRVHDAGTASISVERPEDFSLFCLLLRVPTNRHRSRFCPKLSGQI